MPAEGYVNDPPAAVDADSTNETNDSVIALLKAIKNLQIDLTELNVILAGAVSAGKVQSHVAIDFSNASAQTIIAAPGASNRIRLTRLSLSSGSDPQVNVEVALKTGSTTIETVKGAAMVFDYPEHRNLDTNEAFVVQATTADRIIGGVDYYLEAV